MTAQQYVTHFAWSDDDTLCGPLLDSVHFYSYSPEKVTCLKCLTMLTDSPEYSDKGQEIGPLPHEPQDVTTFVGSSRRILEAIADARELGDETPPWRSEVFGRTREILSGFHEPHRWNPDHVVEELTRDQAVERMDELLALERVS